MKLLILSLFLIPAITNAQYNPLGGNYVDVKGYTKSNGTYVQGYRRQRANTDYLTNSINDNSNYNQALREAERARRNAPDVYNQPSQNTYNYDWDY